MSAYRTILAASPRRVRQVAALLVMTACGGGGDGGPSGPQPAVTAVAITPATVTFDVGATQQLTANVTAVGGAPTTVTWTSTDPTIVAVTVNGMITGVAPGNTTVRATSVFAPTVSATIPVTVNAPPAPAVLSVAIANPPAALIAGTTAQLTAAVQVAGGASAAVTWSSSNNGVATVSTTGLVSAVAAGNVSITATSVADVTKKASATIRIDATAIVTNITVAPATLALDVGGTGQLTATVTVGNNASQQVTWSTGTASVATVDQSGKVTGVAAGTATIRATAQADATKFAESVVTVTLATFPTTAQVTATTLSSFAPPTVDIARGGSVTWVFQSLTHNVTFAGTAGAPNDIGNSTSVSVTRTFNTAGSFGYICTLHGGMSGTVVVH